MKELENRLRDALRSADGAAPTGREVMHGVWQAIEAPRRRAGLGIGRRGWTTAAAAGAVLGVVGAAIVLYTGSDDARLAVPTPSTATQPTSQAASSSRDWRTIATSPLSPRHDTASVWTGSEMIVFGGTDQPPCPPSGDCLGPAADQMLTDGAAYDPDTDTWRRLSDAPQPVTFAQAAWSGDEVVVLAPRLLGFAGNAVSQPAAVLAYDPVADEWRRLDDSPGQYLTGGIQVGDRLAYWHSEETGNDTGDWLLDPADGGWTRLPDDPLPRSFDRSLVWSGDELLLTGLPVNRVDGDDISIYQLASYDPETGEWQRLPDTPVGFWGPDWFWSKGRMVNPHQRAEAGRAEPPPGGVYDPATGAWSPVAETDLSSAELNRGCPLPPLGAAGDWVIAGGYSRVLVSVDPPAVIVAPDCAPLGAADAGAWTGEHLVLWGGPTRSYRDNTATGLVWEPPSP